MRVVWRNNTTTILLLLSSTAQLLFGGSEYTRTLGDTSRLAYCSHALSGISEYGMSVVRVITILLV